MLLRRIISHFRRQEWTAIGFDFLIVVVGVFIGIQVANWNEARNDHSRELERLGALMQNVETTLSDLNADASDASDAIAALESLLVMDGSESEADVTAQLRSALLYGGTFTPELNAYDDLKNSGELAQLSSPDLRLALAKMEADLAGLVLAQTDLATVQQLHIDSFMLDQFQLDQMLGEVLSLPPPANAGAIPASIVQSTPVRNRLLFKLDLVRLVAERFGQAEQSLIGVQEEIDLALDPANN